MTDGIIKHGVRLAFSWEQLAPQEDGEFERTHHLEQPTEQEWVAFSHWKREYEAMQERGRRHDWLQSGWEGDTIEEPCAKWVENR